MATMRLGKAVTGQKVHRSRDVNMPGMDGITSSSHQGASDVPITPVIMLTTESKSHASRVAAQWCPSWPPFFSRTNLLIAVKQ